MIRLAAIMSVAIGLASCAGSESTNSFEVNGVVKNSGAKKIYLEETPMAAGQRIIVDSSQLGADGSFRLSAKTKEESLFTLYLDNAVYPLASVINDAPKITVTADIKNPADPAKATGSPATTSLNDFIRGGNQKWGEINVLGKEIDSLLKAKAPDSLITAVNDRGRSALDNFKRYVTNFIRNAKSPVAAVFPLNDRYSNLYDVQEYDSLINTIEAKFPEHKGIGAVKKMFVDQVAAMQQQSAPPAKWTGKQAPEFALPDLGGREVKLSSFKGKYVLVDFWASWCGPCRQENPNVVAAYNKFKSKNFTILGVSLDSKKNAWEQAIQKDGLTWAHVSDLKQWTSSVVPLYNIDGIPYNVLLDPTGKVIAENLRGPFLDQKLQEVLQ